MPHFQQIPVYATAKSQLEEVQEKGVHRYMIGGYLELRARWCLELSPIQSVPCIARKQCTKYRVNTTTKMVFESLSAKLVLN